MGGVELASKNWRWLSLAAAVAVAVAWRGGFADDARGATAALAGVAVLGAFWWAPVAAGRAARTPVVVALLGLALATAISAAWTIGAPIDAFRDSASVLALAAVVVAASALPGPWGHAGILLAAAVACAVTGLVATLAASEPQALDICGSWRPAGPFEYPPALALVCAGALPVAVAAGTTGRRWPAIGGLAAAWVLGLTAALTVNRTGIALAALALIAVAALAPRERVVGPAVVSLIAAVTASTLILGGDLAEAGAIRIVFAVIPAVALVVVGRIPTGGSGARRWWTAIVVIAALGVTAGGVVADRGGGCGKNSDASHGRTEIWGAAVDTGVERPLTGFGAGTFRAASRERQLELRPRATSYAHDLPLESWVELGLLGLIVVLAWYAAVARLVLQTVRGGPSESVWLLAPAVVAFPLANLLDWPWELLGAGALWAVAAGGLIGQQAAQVPQGSRSSAGQAPRPDPPRRAPRG